MALAYGISATPLGLQKIGAAPEQAERFTHVQVCFPLAEDSRFHLHETLHALRAAFPALTFSFRVCPQTNLCDPMPAVRGAWLEETARIAALCKREGGLFTVIPCGMIWGEGAPLPQRRGRALSLLADSLEALCDRAETGKLVLESAVLPPSAALLPLGTPDDLLFLLDAVWNDRLGLCLHGTENDLRLPAREWVCVRPRPDAEALSELLRKSESLPQPIWVITPNTAV